MPQTVSPPKVFANNYEFADLEQVKAHGQAEENALRADLQRHAATHGWDLGTVTVRWRVEVRATGWKMPKGLLPTDTTLPDFEEQVARIREVWLGHIERLDGEGRVEPIVVDILTSKHLNF